MIPMRTFLLAAAACLWAGAAVAQYNSGATLNSAGSAVGGVPGHGIVIGPGSRQLQDTGGPPGTVTSVSVAPGHTTQVGVCNSSTNTITVSGTISGQTCALPVIANTTLGAPNAGAITIANGPGLTIKAPNPIGATQGVPWVVGGDGTDTFTLTTVSGTAQFYGCGLAGTGATSLTVPGTALVVITDDESSGSRYYCWTQGATVLANGATQGIMKGDGSTITCTTGTCSAVTGGSPAEVFISTNTPSSGSGCPGTNQCISMTGLTSTYNTYHVNCTGILSAVGGDVIAVEIEIGSTWENSSYLVMGAQSGATDGTASPTGNNSNATATDITNGPFHISTTIPMNFVADVNLPASSAQKNIVWYGNRHNDSSGSDLTVWGASRYTGGTGAIVGIRVRDTTATDTFTAGQCTLSGRH